MLSAKPLTETKRRLIAALQRNGRSTLVELASKLGLSHVAVKKNLDGVLREGLIRVGADLSPRALGIKLVLLLLECRDYRSQAEIIERFRECPRVVFFSPLIGGYNMLAIMAAENMHVLESITTVCAIRTMEGVRRSEVILLGDPVYPTHLPLRLIERRSKGKAPCGFDCYRCGRFMEKECLGCPATRCYRGPL